MSFSTTIKSLGLILVSSILASNAEAQNYVYLYRYQPANVGSGGGATTQYRYDQQLMPAAVETYGGATYADTWRNFLESDQIIGKGGTLTRAWDIMEDFAVNWIRDENPNINFYQNFPNATNTYVSRSGYPLTLTGGPHAGESVFNNPNMLGMGDDKYFLYDGDGTISSYNYAGGTLNTNYTWQNFSGGIWDGLRLVDMLQYMIGTEEGSLIFLTGENTIVSYLWAGTPTSGIPNGTYTYEFSGDLAQYSLRQIVDGEIDGYTYIGWDVGAIIVGVDAEFGPGSIPEPSSIFLGSFGLLALLTRRRR